MTRQKLMDSAFEIFSRGTYSSVSLVDIAEKAGIKKPSIYAHFVSKEDLFLKVLDREILNTCIHMGKY